MANDNGLVDEYEKLQSLKKEIESKEEVIKNKIIELAREKNTDILFGTKMKCSVKEYEKVIYPEDKTALVEIIKQLGFYDRFSAVSYPKLGSAIIKNDVNDKIIALIRKEKDYRVSLRDIWVEM